MRIGAHDSGYLLSHLAQFGKVLAGNTELNRKTHRRPVFQAQNADTCVRQPGTPIRVIGGKIGIEPTLQFLTRVDIFGNHDKLREVIVE